MSKTKTWQRFFDAHAPDYDSNVFTQNTRFEVDYLEKKLGLEPGAEILDLGCGTGRHSLELARRGYRPTGLDLSPEMLALAEKSARAESLDIRWVRADATSFDPPGEFDAGICLCEGSMGLLSEGDDPLEQPLSILRNLSRCLRPAAPAALTVLNGAALLRRYKASDIAAGKFDPLALTESVLMAPRKGEDEIPGRERGFVGTELRMLFKLSGLEITWMGGGTAGMWGDRPLDLDEIEIMVLARKAGPLPKLPWS